MTPLPKNKITRAERGKRRAGNTPSLRRDANQAKLPRHKATFMATLDTFMNKKSSATKAAANQALSEKMSASRKENKSSQEQAQSQVQTQAEIKAPIAKNLTKAAPINKTSTKNTVLNKKASTSK